MKIVVGLGNPGKQYEGTRHNVGWMVLDRIADRAGWSGRVKARDAAAVVRGRWADTDLELVKPTTYMNLSGLAVRKVLARERVGLEDLLVVVDDFSLPLGRLRLREEGSAGGHNGLRSIVAEMGTQRFARLRVGIGEPGRSAVDHVLSRFGADEQADLDRVLAAAADAVEEWARDGVSRAANRWNAWSLPVPEPASGGATAGAPDGGGTGDGAATVGDPVPKPASRDSTAGASAGGDTADGPATGVPGPAEATGAGHRSRPDATGVVRSRTGWRKLLAGGGHEEPGR